MPIYSYTCTACNDVIEKRQSFTDSPLTTCEKCGGTLRKIIAPEGATVPVGQPIALIGEPAEPIPAEFGGAPAQATQATKAPAAQPAPPAAQSAAKTKQVAQPARAAASVAVANGHVAQPSSPSATPSVTQHGQDGGRIFISPLARHIAAEHNLDIEFNSLDAQRVQASRAALLAT